MKEMIMRGSILGILGAVVAVAGCSHNKENTNTEELRPGATAETQGGATTAEGGMCPMQVSGTTVQAEDTSSGAALVFKTTGDVSELRNRVRHMADMHNRRQSQSGATSSTASQGAGASSG